MENLTLSNDDLIIQIPQKEYLRLMTLAGEYRDEEFDSESNLNEFRDDFLHESDVELERKRMIMRNRILADHNKEESQQKHQILTRIIQDNMKRRAEFEQNKELANWARMFLSLILGFVLGYVLNSIN